ncbi:MAG: hypothetical protein ACYCZF_10190 [Anaerolineae bacterium]
MQPQPCSRRTLLRHAALSAAALGINQFALACTIRSTLTASPTPSVKPPAASATPAATSGSSPTAAATPTATPVPTATLIPMEPTAPAPVFPTPLHWGFDDAGGPAHLELTSWAAQCISEFRFDTWVLHYMPSSTVESDIAQIQCIDAWCAKQGVQWILNVEHANWIASHTDSKGREWFNRPDGRQYFLFPDDILEELGQCKQLGGLMYDEAEHMQNCRHMINSINKPFFYDPEDQRLVDAAEGLTSACREIVAHHARFGLHLFTESVFPVMLDSFTRAGFTAATKILKENWSPAYYAVALGAARQYGTELWVTPDLWGDCGQGGFMNKGYPGHSVDEYRSALLMAYALGADCIYTENLAYDNLNKGLGSLVQAKPLKYEVTPYGEVTRAFRKEYVPSHPRMYRWQDVRPRTAIIHQTDGCWGQRTSWLPDTLFGHPDWRSDEVTEGWLRVFHLLSRGVIPPDALSWHNTNLCKSRPYQLFCPLDGVIVYDHLVTAPYLQGLELIFLTGIGVSQVTLEAVRQAVRDGATCIGRLELLPQDVRAAAAQGPVSDGVGKWLASETFLDDAVRQAVEPFLPAEDELTYRFGDTQVRLRPINGDPNHLESDTIALVKTIIEVE